MSGQEIGLVVIGGSAGSLQVILGMLPSLHKNLSFPILIVVHRKPGVESPLVTLLQSKTQIPIKELEEKDLLLNGHIYVAPANYHTLVEADKSLSLDYSEKIHYSRPAIDASFETASDVFKNKTVGILLSGANADGVRGLIKIKRNGGVTAIQNPKSAEISYMPDQALRSKAIDFILENNEIASFINQLSIQYK